MSRKATRRAERAVSLRRRLLAGATTVILGLGLSVGGLYPALAVPGSGGGAAPLPVVTGVTFTDENGLTCTKAGFEKPDAMDSASGTYTGDWGSATWSTNGAFTWNLTPGYDVDFCVKGSTIVADIDSSVFSGTSFSFKNLTGHGISHVGYRVVSTPEPDEELVVPTASMEQLACDTSGSYTLGGDVEGVVWFVSVNGGDFIETEPGTYPVTSAQTVEVRAERESSDYGFATETETEWTFGFLEPTDCAEPPPPCLPTSAVSYTYYNLSTGTESNPENSGLITVRAMEGYSDELCKPFWVVAASWDFVNLDNVWPQTLRSTDPAGDDEDGYVDSVGTYYFYAPVDCGQGDIYASFTSMPYIGTELYGPSNPFSEKFLHNMGFTGPQPTYLVTNPGCNEAEPIDPTATPILECGTYGSIDVSDVENPYVRYTVYRGAAAGGSVDGLETVSVDEAKEGVFTVVATAMNGYVFAEGTTTQWEFDLGNYFECPEATATVAVADPSCFSGSTLDESEFSSSDGVTWSIIDDGATSGSYEVLFTAPEGSRFANGEKTFTATGDLAPALGDEDCVLPVTNVFLAFTDATCLNPQGLDTPKFDFEPTLAEMDGDPVVDSDGNYTVVFTALGEKTVFDQSDDVAQEGRTVSSDGKTITFTGTLEGPNEELCEEIPIIDPFVFEDTCLSASFTLYFVEGLTYTATIGAGAPFEVEFTEFETEKTFSVNAGDYVVVTLEAQPGYVLAPDQPAPLERTFATYPDDCQLPVLANWPASVTDTDEVCTPFGAMNGSITVLFSEGPAENLNPVQYYIAYGTADQQELTSATTTVPAGDYVVTAVATEPTDSINDAGNTAEFEVTVAAAVETDCDLPTLAITGASNAVTGVGIGAVIIILAGLGFVLRRQLVA